MEIFSDECAIFRINTKQVASNVALRRQVFESKANSSDASWRCSSDDKSKDDKDVRASQSRSLSVESVKENEVAPSTAAAMKKERPKPVRENSYLTAVRSSPEVAPVTLRQKAQTHHRMMSEEDDRKTRRTSYLKATNEEFQVASDTDQNSVSMTPEDEDNHQQMKR
jgi:hypothetical protein